jgi:hypothetical protein
MMAMMGFAVLVVATLAATGLAALLDWLLLRAVFQLMMQPAAVGVQRTARVSGGPGELVRGTVQLTRAFAGQR